MALYARLCHVAPWSGDDHKLVFSCIIPVPTAQPSNQFPLANVVNCAGAMTKGDEPLVAAQGVATVRHVKPALSDSCNCPLDDTMNMAFDGVTSSSRSVEKFPL